MRIGIVSIFDNRNFGNRLQNYALQQVLLRYADEAVTIKNKPFSNGKSRLVRASALAESEAFNHLLGMHRRAQLVRFTNRYVHTNKNCYWYEKEYPSLKKEDCCDFYCAGSDQVWNPNCRQGQFSYLGFADYDATFSYAASFGDDKIPQGYEEAVRKGLQHIKHISVREDAGKRIVEELTGRTDVQVLVDPTMLLTREEWDEVAAKPRRALPERYLLTCFLGGVSPERKDAILQKAKELGCQVIELMDPKSPFYEIGPGEFIDLIKHADLICTDSFHASVFSFLYQRPLAIFDRQGGANKMGGRMETLASKFQLESSLIQENQIPDGIMTPDYSAGYKALEAEREKAKAFLDMVFSEIERS